MSKLFTPCGRKPRYPVARADDGGIIGVMPMFLMESRVFGRKLVSVPFAPYGGVCADDAGVGRALVGARERVARGEFSMSLIENGDTMRYVVGVDELTSGVSMDLKKNNGVNNRVIHIFSLINNMIAIETENIERIKELNGVSRVRESGICETHAQPMY